MATGLIDIMKRASMDAEENSKPCDLRYGTVISTNPMQIQITPQFVLPMAALIIPEHLTNRTITVGVAGTTNSSGSHTHSITGKTEKNTDEPGEESAPKHTHTYNGSAEQNGEHSHGINGQLTVTIYNALKVNDKVALLRQRGGQFYFVLDRI